MPSSPKAISARSPESWRPTTQYSRDFLENPQRQRAENKLIEGPGGELWSQCGSCGDIVPFPGAQNDCCLKHPLRPNRSPLRAPSSVASGESAEEKEEEEPAEHEIASFSPIRPRNLDRQLETARSDSEEDSRGEEPSERQRSSGRRRHVPQTRNPEHTVDRHAEPARDISPTLPFFPHWRHTSDFSDAEDAGALARGDAVLSSTLALRQALSREHVGSRRSSHSADNEEDEATSQKHVENGFAREISPTLPFHPDEEQKLKTPRSPSAKRRKRTNEAEERRGTQHQGAGNQRISYHMRRSYSERRRLAAVAAQMGNSLS